MSRYDDILQEEEEQSALTGAPDDRVGFYDSLLREDSRKEIRNTLKTATERNPDEFARALPIAEQAGIPPEPVLNNLPEVEKAQTLGRYERILDDNPELGAFYKDVKNASIAHDDIDTLEAITQGLKTMGAAAAMPFRAAYAGSVDFINSGFLAGELGLRIAENEIGEPLKKHLGIDNPFTEARQSFETQRKANQEYSADLVAPAQEHGAFISGAVSGFQSFGAQLPFLVGGVLSRNPNAMLAGAGGAEFLRSTQDAIDHGLSTVHALVHGAAKGLVEAATEKLPFFDLLKNVQLGKGFLRSYLENLPQEIVGEQAATALQDLLDWANLNPDATIGDYMAARPEAALATLGATITGTAANVGAVKGAQAVGDLVLRSAARQQELHLRALQDAENLKGVLDTAAASLTRERSPETFQGLAQSLAQSAEGAPEEIFIDAEKLLEILGEEGVRELRQSSAAVHANFDEALNLSGTVAIPMGEILTNFAGSGLEAALVENARISPFAPSAAEAKQAGTEAQDALQNAANDAFQAQTDQDAWIESGNQVEGVILEQLEGAGRFSTDVNKAYARLTRNFFDATAARLNITPEELYQRFSLTVSAKSPTGQSLNAGEPPAFRDAPLVFRQVRDRFLSGLPEDAEFEDAADFFNSDAVTKEERDFFNALERDDFLGFDLPSQAINAALSGELEDFDPSPGLKSAIGRLVNAQLAQQPLRQEQQDAEGQGVQQETQTAEALTAASVETAFEIASGQRFKRNRDLKQILQDQVRAALRSAGIKLGDKYAAKQTAKDPKAVEYLVQAAVSDALTSLQQNVTAEGWYDEKTKQALAVMALIHPELETDPISKFSFTAALAITSNGMKVDRNFILAEKAYAAWKETGRMPEDIGEGTAAGKINEALQKFNRLAEEFGIEELRQFMESDYTVREIRMAGENVSGEGVDTVVKGAAIFGPKIGNGFFSNLNGDFSKVTIDRWLMTTFGRWTGTLLEDTKAGIAAQQTRILAEIDILRKNPVAVKVIQQLTQTRGAGGIRIRGRMTRAEVRALAEKLTRVSTNKEKRELLESVSPELRKASINLAKQIDGQRLSPQGVEERNLIREVLGQTLSRLHDLGYNNLTMADLQAVLWFPEKRLFDAAKSADDTADKSYDEDKAPDYANAAAALAASKGIDGSRIAEAADSVSGGARVRAERAGTARTGGDPATGQSGSQSLAQSEKLTPGADLMLEVAPDPRDTALTARWDALTDEQKHVISVDVAQQILPQVFAAHGVTGEVRDQLGGWHGATNPSLAARLDDTSNLAEIARDIAAALSQEAVFAISETPFEGADQANTITIDIGDADAGAIYDQLWGAIGLPLEGHSTSNGVMAIAGIPESGIDQLLEQIDQALNGQYTVHTHESYSAGVTPNADHQTSAGDAAAGGPSVQGRGRDLQAEATRLLEERLAAAEAGTLSAPQDLGAGGGTRGTFTPETVNIALLEKADLSTFLHELGHFFFETTAQLATDPGAPPELRADIETLLRWGGFEGTVEDWMALDLDARRDLHEQFAESFEQYLFEGRSPDPEMRSLFQRFRAWLTTVYTDLKSFLAKNRNARLTDEVSEVMDRMVATASMINQAREEQAADAMFQSAEEAGMTAEEFAVYQEDQRRDIDEANEYLNDRSLRNMKWLENAKSKVLRKLQKDAREKRAAVQKEVTAEIEAMPVYQAMHFIRTGKLPDGMEDSGLTRHKLDAGILREMYGEHPDAPWRKIATNLLSRKEGIHPDVLASLFGYDSGDALVREIANAEKRAELIKARTDRVMLERFGDLTSPEVLQEAVNEALHNDVRGKVLATEAAALARMLGQKAPTRDAAKRAAERATNRRKVKEAQPHRFSAAERKAGSAAQKARDKADLETAAREKRNQLLNFYLAREAQLFRRFVEKAQRRYKTIFGSDKRLAKNRNMDLVNTARAVLGMYGLAPEGVVRNAVEQLELLRQYDAEMFAEVQSILSQLPPAQPHTELTVEQFRGLNDVVASLWQLSRRSKVMMIEGQQVEIEAAADELVGRINELAGPGGLPSLPGHDSTSTEKDAFKKGLLGFKARRRRVENWVNEMGGNFKKYIFTPVIEAVTKYRTRRNELVAQYRDILAGLDLSFHPISAPELGGFTFSGGKSEVIHAILHSGNQSNLRKLLLGHREKWGIQVDEQTGDPDPAPWNSFLDRMYSEGVVTESDMQAVQRIWDLMESMKPEAQRAHKDMYGYFFSEITADPIQTPWGEFRGGYVPALTDPLADGATAAKREAEDLLHNSNAQMFPTTGKGFTMSRVENFAKPLQLDLRTLPMHIDKVTRFSFIEPVVKDVSRLLRNNKLLNALNRHDSALVESMLIPWLRRTAQQTVSTPSDNRTWDKWLNLLRTRTGQTIMFANVANALQQLTGLSVAALKVDARYLMPAVLAYMRHPRATADHAAAVSPWMKDRMEAQSFEMQGAIRSLLEKDNIFEKSSAFFDRHAYFMQQALQNLVDIIVWTGSFNQSLAEGKTENEARLLADEAVRTTQGSFAPEDISAVESGTQAWRLFVQFYSYFNAIGDLLATESRKVLRDAGYTTGTPRLLGIWFMGFALPAILASVIAQGLPDDDEDDEGDGLWDEYLGAAIGSLGSTLSAMTLGPIGAKMAQMVANQWDERIYNDRLQLSPALSKLEIAAGAIDGRLFDEELKGKEVRDVLTLIGMATGLPMGQLGKTLGFVADVQRGANEPEDASDVAVGLIRGR